MPSPSSAPLTEDHYAILNRVLEALPATEALITKCKNCGLDVANAEAEHAAQKDLATKLKQQFFPHRP